MNNLNLESSYLNEKKLPYDLKLYLIKIKEVLLHQEVPIKKWELEL